MSKDYYNILGVDKKASKEDIKKAFYKIAHKHHPDKKGGDEKIFKEANEAYQTLSDDQKRAQYDQFGANYANMGGFAGGQGYGQGGFGGFEGFDFSGFQGGFGQGGVEFDLNDIFSEFFGGGRGRTRKPRGRDISTEISITFSEAIFGVTKKVFLTKKGDSKGNQEITINVPEGVNNGDTLRMTGMGEAISGGTTGDLYIKIRVAPHTHLRREGYDLVMNLDIKLTDALLGTKHTIETLDGKMEVSIPEGIAVGEILRVKGKGVPHKGRRGDLLLRTHIKMPAKLSKKEKELIEQLKEQGI
ncbi:MAG: DnaJ C-terminal domain-containing protein [Candidatus Paceibacterota bacterium]